MPSLNKQHHEYIDRVKKNGGQTYIRKMPCCGHLVEDRLSSGNEVWDTLAVCPVCDTTYWKVTFCDHIESTLLSNMK